jgi:hypothetical protein
MPGVSVQFHMLPEEIIAFVADVMSRYSLGAELERFFPPGSCEVPVDADVAKAASEFGRFDRIWLLFRPPRCRKFESFMLNIGGLKGTRLDQAHFGGSTDKPAALSVLKQIARDLKRATAPGIWVIGATGHVGYAKEFRFSPGAASRARSGEIELTMGGTTQQFMVDEPFPG